MSNNHRPLLRAWVPALLWLAVIACESTSLGGSEETSRLLLPLLTFFLPHLTAAQFHLAHALLRKTGHFVGYGVLSLVMFRGWWATFRVHHSGRRLASWRDMMRDWSARAAATALFSTATVAALDEWHQKFLPGRTSSVHDVILDSAAGLCAQMLLIALSDTRRVEKKQLAISN